MSCIFTECFSFLIDIQQHRFQSIKEFQHWKEREEMVSRASFPKSTQAKQGKDGTFPLKSSLLYIVFINEQAQWHTTEICNRTN